MSSEDFKFKRDLSHDFHIVHSFRLKNKCKKRNKPISVYTGNITRSEAIVLRYTTYMPMNITLQLLSGAMPT